MSIDIADMQPGYEITVSDLKTTVAMWGHVWQELSLVSGISISPYLSVSTQMSYSFTLSLNWV